MSTQTIPVGPDDSLEIEDVGGDLALQGWDRPDVQASGEQVRLEKEDGPIAVSCGGDLTLSVPKGMTVSVGNVGGDATIEGLSGSVELGLVGGDASLRNLTGAVRLTGLVGGDTRMENVANVSVNPGNRGPDFDIGDRIRRRVQKATQKAERKLRRAHADHISKHYRAQFDTSGWKYNSGSDASTSAEPGEPVSEEERMTILRMLQEKKITSEEAEKLLSALEGSA